MRPSGQDGMYMEDKKQCACRKPEDNRAQDRSDDAKAADQTHWDGSGD